MPLHMPHTTLSYAEARLDISRKLMMVDPPLRTYLDRSIQGKCIRRGDWITTVE